MLGFLPTIITIVVIIIIVIVVVNLSSEHLSDHYYLDQMAMKSFNPDYIQYFGRDKDVLGMDHRDYYLENKMYANSGAAPQRLIADSAYFDHTDYLGMPNQYRPRPLAHHVKE